MNKSIGKKPSQKKSAEGLGVLGRAFAILRCVAETAPINSREIVMRVGISKATVSRVTAKLISLNLLRQVRGTGQFTLTPAVLDLSKGYLRSFDLRTVARTYMLELAEFAGASVHLCVRDRFDMVVIETVRPTSELILSRLGVGGRLDLGSSAAGRAYLSATPEPDRGALLNGLGIATGNQWPAVNGGINQALEETAKHGFCTSVGEWHSEISAAAVALISPTEDCYVITCGGLAHILTRERLVDCIGPRLVACAEKIAHETGGRTANLKAGQTAAKSEADSVRKGTKREAVS
jgi:DNA-binding IclR family transcriptional regulator